MSASAAAVPPARPRGALKPYVDLARPFTLLPPALGVVSGAVTAWGAGHHKLPVTAALVMPVVFGAVMAAVLNAANNALNQIYDLDIDRVNKPARPLPSGALSLGQAWVFTIVTCGPFTGRLPMMDRLLELAPSRPAWPGFRGGRIGPVKATLVTDDEKRIVYAVLLVFAAFTWLKVMTT